MERGWHPVGPGTPLHAWLETMLDGEKGTNVCMCRIMAIGDDPEWIEKSSGRTTITHHSFAAPTWWRWPQEASVGHKVFQPVVETVKQ